MKSMGVKIDKPRNEKEGIEHFAFSGVPSYSDIISLKDQGIINTTESVNFLIQDEDWEPYDDTWIRPWVIAKISPIHRLILLLSKQIKDNQKQIKMIWEYLKNLQPGGTSLFKSYMKADAGEATTATCYLYEDASDTEITVNFEIIGTGNLDDACPPLKDGDLVYVVNDDGDWRAVFPVDTVSNVRAYVNTVPNDTYFTAYLYADAQGDAVNVYPEILGTGTKVDEVWPVLVDGDMVYVTWNEVADRWETKFPMLTITDYIDNDTIKTSSRKAYVTFDTG